MDSIASAAKSEYPALRLAAVQALSKMKGAGKNPQVINLINGLLDDKNAGVKKFALKTTRIAGISSLNEKIKHISEFDQSNKIKKLAEDVLQQLKIAGDTPTL